MIEIQIHPSDIRRRVRYFFLDRRRVVVGLVVLSFVLAGQRTEDVGGILDRDGIAVRSGHHCAQPALRRFRSTLALDQARRRPGEGLA